MRWMTTLLSVACLFSSVGALASPGDVGTHSPEHEHAVESDRMSTERSLTKLSEWADRLLVGTITRRWDIAVPLPEGDYPVSLVAFTTTDGEHGVLLLHVNTPSFVTVGTQILGGVRRARPEVRAVLDGAVPAYQIAPGGRLYVVTGEDRVVHRFSELAMSPVPGTSFGLDTTGPLTLEAALTVFAEFGIVP